MTSLYQLTNEYRELENMDLDDDTLADTLESLEGEFDAKADAICHVLANLKDFSDGCSDEAERLLTRRNVIDKRIEGLKDYLRERMEALGKKKIESAKFTILCVAGRDKVNVTDESKIEDGYFITIPESRKLDKKLLLEVIKSGTFGEKGGAELVKSKSSLRIK